MQQYEGIQVGTYPLPDGPPPTTGTVTSVSVNTANGFAGSVDNPTTTPAINIQTTVTGILKGNGVSVSAADPSDFITSNAFSLIGNDLTSSVNTVDSNSIKVQVPIASPVANDLVAMDSTGLVIDSGVKVTTSAVSNDNTHVMTSAAVQTGLSGKEPTITDLPVVKGGTGLVSYTIGDLLVASANTVLTTIAAPILGKVLVSQGTGVIPIYTSNPTIDTITLARSTNQLFLGSAPNVMTVTTASLTGNRTLTLPDANSNTVQPSSAPTNQFATGISSAGVISYGSSANTLSSSVNTMSSTVNGASSTAAIVNSNALSLSGTTLTSTINGVAATASVQPLITSPVANDIVTMNGGGQIIDSGVQITTSAVSNDNTHIMTSAAVQAAITSSPGGTVTSTSVVTANGFAGTVATSTTTPAISIQTSVTGILKGNGTSVSAAIATDIPTTNSLNSTTNTLTSTVNSVAATGVSIINSHTLSSSVNTMTDVVNGVSANAPIINTNALNSATNTLTSTINGVAATGVNIINSHTLSSSVNTMTDVVNGVSANAPIINTNALNSTTNTLTSTINGVAATGVSIVNSHTLSSSVNTMTDVVNGVSANAPIINSHTLSSSTNTLTSTINGVAATAQVSPSGQSVTSSITFTLLSEIIIVCAPSVNAVGNYGLRLKDSSGNELDILFNVLCNQNTYYNQSQIQIVKVNDSQGVVTESNISNYLLFRGYLRNSTPNSYFVVTLSMPYTLLYSNPLSMTLTQYSFSYLNENTTITNMITTDISNLVSVYQADLIFRMQLFYIPVSISNPQGYTYFVSTNTVYQSSVNPLTGALSALSPSSLTVTGATNFVATTLRNYAYCTAGSNVIMLKIATNGTLTITAPTITAQAGSTGIAIEPTDRFLYVAGTSSGFVQVFSITKSSGLITSIQTVNAAFGITQIAVHPSGKYLYVINQSSNVVYMYNIDPSTGFLTAMTTPTVATGTTPGRIKVHPNGNFAYVTNNGAGTITIYTIDTTGKLTFSATYTPVGFSGIKGLCIHPNGNFIFFTSESTNSLQQSTINTGTGAISSPSTGQTINGARDCCIDFSGTYLYVANNTNTRIDEYSVNSATGATTYITSLTTSANSTDIACV